MTTRKCSHAKAKKVSSVDQNCSFTIFIHVCNIITLLHAGLTLEGEEVALWLLTSLCTSAKREVEVAL